LFKNLTTAHSASAISSSDIITLQKIFDDEKTAKQVLNAAKRLNKKRSSGTADAESSPPKKRSRAADIAGPEEDLEASLALPPEIYNEEALSKCIIYTNRAPVVLAFGVQLLKYTMPEQPLSSRLSLAQAMVSVNSRSKAVSLGLESGKSAEEEGWGQGQPMVRVMGRDVRTMKRWGYEWKKDPEDASTQASSATVKGDEDGEEKPALWGLDLEALKKKSDSNKPGLASSTNLPIHTPQSARAYLFKSFDSPPVADGDDGAKKKPKSAAAKQSEKEENLGKLLGALDIVYKSWAGTLDTNELDRRAWQWYIRVRPTVPDGVAGWGGKAPMKLADVLALRRTP
jgi:hypothetical protein